MLNDFKAFVMRGNVLDLAVAVILGAAFGKIVTSFVDDLLMPPLGALLGGVDFKELFIDLSGQGHASLAAAKAAGAATINYGVFLNTVVQFLIVAFAVSCCSDRCSGSCRPRRRAGVPAVPLHDPPQPWRCAHCTSALTV